MRTGQIECAHQNRLPGPSIHLRELVGFTFLYTKQSHVSLFVNRGPLSTKEEEDICDLGEDLPCYKLGRRSHLNCQLFFEDRTHFLGRRREGRRHFVLCLQDQYIAKQLLTCSRDEVSTIEKSTSSSLSITHNPRLQTSIAERLTSAASSVYL